MQTRDENIYSEEMEKLRSELEQLHLTFRTKI